MTLRDQQVANLWLADELWKLGAIQFGDFTIGHNTINSPVYINLRLLISNPQALQRAAEVMWHEVCALQSMRQPRIQDYDLVAGVPFGGLHLATAFSLRSSTPMIYLHPPKDGPRTIVEGNYNPGQTVLILDDLITGGRSIIHTAQRLEEDHLIVEDALVLIDRQQGAHERLKQRGVNLQSILTLESVLHYLGSSRKISEEWYHKSLEYLGTNRSGA
jgi:orotate phosphoribosyltransferase/uridine monophosphate synthetase